MAKLDTVRKALAEGFEYIVVNAKGGTISLMSKKTHRYERSFGSESEALKAIAGLKSSKGLTVKKSKKVVSKPSAPKTYTKKQADELVAYYSRKPGSYTGD